MHFDKGPHYIFDNFFLSFCLFNCVDGGEEHNTPLKNDGLSFSHFKGWKVLLICLKGYLICTV